MTCGVLWSIVEMTCGVFCWCRVEITDDFDFKDHIDGNHFLACEIDSRVAARICMHLERKKQGSAASKVELEAQHAQLTRPTQRIPTPCIVAVKIT